MFPVRQITPKNQPRVILRSATTLQIALAFIWAGLVLGISFIGVPLMFQASGLTEVQAVRIGKLLISTLNRIELSFTVLLFGALFFGHRDKWRLFRAALILLIVSAQTFWLLPILYARAELLFDGNPAPPSDHHLIYIALEAAKFLALFTFGFAATNSKDLAKDLPAPRPEFLPNSPGI